MVFASPCSLHQVTLLARAIDGTYRSLQLQDITEHSTWNLLPGNVLNACLSSNQQWRPVHYSDLMSQHGQILLVVIHKLQLNNYQADALPLGYYAQYLTIHSTHTTHTEITVKLLRSSKNTTTARCALR